METNCSEMTHVKKGVILAQVKINIQPLNDLICICTVLKTTYMILTVKTYGFFFEADLSMISGISGGLPFNMKTSMKLIKDVFR